MGEDKRLVIELMWKERYMICYVNIKFLIERYFLLRLIESNWYLVFLKILLFFVCLIGYLGIFFVVIINLFIFWFKIWILFYLIYGCCLFLVVWRYFVFIGSFINYG